jgi:hypothetical protein
MAQYAHKKMIHNQIIFFSKKGKKKKKEKQFSTSPRCFEAPARSGRAATPYGNEGQVGPAHRKRRKKGNKMWDDITPKNVYI